MRELHRAGIDARGDLVTFFTACRRSNPSEIAPSSMPDAISTGVSCAVTIQSRAHVSIYFVPLPSS
jgi:hypothetical protein